MPICGVSSSFIAAAYTLVHLAPQDFGALHLSVIEQPGEKHYFINMAWYSNDLILADTEVINVPIRHDLLNDYMRILCTSPAVCC
jgi:hypothetical protein